MLKNSKVVLFVTLKSWSGRKLLDPTTYYIDENKRTRHKIDSYACAMYRPIAGLNNCVMVVSVSTKYRNIGIVCILL